ncbi:MAG TPA: hypothetical protein VIU12_31455 [Chryseolinea sp.]
MKYLFFLVLSLALGIEGFSQQNDSLNIYLVSLTSHLEYLKSKSKENIQSVYVERDDLVTGSLPKQIDGITIFYLTRLEIRDKTRKGKRIPLIVIRPVKVERTSLKISIIDFSVTTKKNSFNYSNGGGSTLEFRYNCDLQKFELTNKKQGGI